MHFSDALGVGEGKAFGLAVDSNRKILEILQLLAESDFIAVNVEQNRDQSLRAARVVDHLLRPEEVLVFHVVHDLALEKYVSRMACL